MGQSAGWICGGQGAGWVDLCGVGCKVSVWGREGERTGGGFVGASVEGRSWRGKEGAGVWICQGMGGAD